MIHDGGSEYDKQVLAGGYAPDAADQSAGSDPADQSARSGQGVSHKVTT